MPALVVRQSPRKQPAYSTRRIDETICHVDAPAWPIVSHNESRHTHCIWEDMPQQVSLPWLAAAFSFASIFHAAAASAEVLTLSDFLSQVRQANPTLAAAHARAQALEHRVGPVSTLDDPFIAAGVDEIPFGGGGNSVIRYQLSQAVPFPGKLGARGSAVRRRADAALADVETARRTDRYITQALSTYFNDRVLRLPRKPVVTSGNDREYQSSLQNWGQATMSGSWGASNLAYWKWSAATDT